MAGAEPTNNERDEGPAWERVADAGSEISRLHGGAMVAEARRGGPGGGRKRPPAPHSSGGSRQVLGDWPRIGQEPRGWSMSCFTRLSTLSPPCTSCRGSLALLYSSVRLPHPTTAENPAHRRSCPV